MSDQPAAPSEPLLNGWKEIAAYLGKSVRSVQRWETALGLPVHRIRTPYGQIIYANRDEIDVWRQMLDEPNSPEVDPSRETDASSAAAQPALTLVSSPVHRPMDPTVQLLAAAPVPPTPQVYAGLAEVPFTYAVIGVALFVLGLCAGWLLAQ